MAHAIETRMRELAKALDEFNKSSADVSHKRALRLFNLSAASVSESANLRAEIQSTIADAAGVGQAMALLKAAMANGEGALQKLANQARKDEAILKAKMGDSGAHVPLTSGAAVVVDLRNAIEGVVQKGEFLRTEVHKFVVSVDRDPNLAGVKSKQALEKVVKDVKEADKWMTSLVNIAAPMVGFLNEKEWK